MAKIVNQFVFNGQFRLPTFWRKKIKSNLFFFFCQMIFVFAVTKSQEYDSFQWQFGFGKLI